MNWHKYLDDDYEDEMKVVERIKHPPRKYEDDEKKTTSRRERPKNPNKE